MDYKKIAVGILKNIGGNDNIESVTYCATRLRFVLKDENKANDEAIKKVSGVIGIRKNRTSYQIIIGQNVGNVYKEYLNISHDAGNNEEKKDNDKSDRPVTIEGYIAPVETSMNEVLKMENTAITENKEITETTGLTETTDIAITAPIEGKTVSIHIVADPIFSKEILGKGLAIIPTRGRLVAPFDGKVVSLFKTKHAIGLQSVDGVEVLIHIGINTVKLNGQYFIDHVKSGDKVKKGDLLIEFDIERMKEAGYDVITPVIVTNHTNYSKIFTYIDKLIKENEIIIKVIENKQ